VKERLTIEYSIKFTDICGGEEHKEDGQECRCHHRRRCRLLISHGRSWNHLSAADKRHAVTATGNI